MLKKISADGDVMQLKKGDYIFDHSSRSDARNFKIRIILFGYIVAFYGGDFPSLKILSRSQVIRGRWWMEE